MNRVIAVSFNAPGACRFQCAFWQSLESLPSIGGKASGVTEPVILRADQSIITFATKVLVLLATNSIDGFAEMFGDMEFIKHNLDVGIFQVRPGGSNVGIDP